MFIITVDSKMQCYECQKGLSGKIKWSVVRLLCIECSQTYKHAQAMKDGRLSVHEHYQLCSNSKESRNFYKCYSCNAAGCGECNGWGYLNKAGRTIPERG